MAAEWIGLDTLLKAGGALVITDVEERENITYFKINGWEFQTYGNKVFSKNNPSYDHDFHKFLAKKDVEPDTIDYEQIQQEVDHFLEHKAELMELLLPEALIQYSKHGRDAMMKVFDDVVDICPGEGSARMIEQIIDKKEGKNDEPSV